MIEHPIGGLYALNDRWLAENTVMSNAKYSALLISSLGPPEQQLSRFE